MHLSIQPDRYMRWRFATGPELSPEAPSVARRCRPSAFVREKLQGSRLEWGPWAVLASLAGDPEGLIACLVTRCPWRTPTCHVVSEWSSQRSLRIGPGDDSRYPPNRYPQATPNYGKDSPFWGMHSHFSEWHILLLMVGLL